MKKCAKCGSDWDPETWHACPACVAGDVLKKHAEKAERKRQENDVTTTKKEV